MKKIKKNLFIMFKLIILKYFQLMMKLLFFMNYFTILKINHEGVNNIGQGSGYSYNGIEDLSIHFRKIDLNRGASYIQTPTWLSSKGATINPKNESDTLCFSYAVAISLFHEELGAHPERINDNLRDKVKKLDWQGIDFPASTQDYHTFEKNNENITLNVLFIAQNSRQIRQDYISKHNFTRNEQVTILKITDGEKWHFLALKLIKQSDDTYKPTKAFSRLM